MQRVGAWALLLCAACSRKTAPISLAQPSSSVAASAAEPAASPPASSVVARGEPLERRVGQVNALEAARSLVAAWDQALNAHDLRALEALYAAHVSFYGNQLPRAAVIDLKRRALAATPEYKQEVVDIQVRRGSGESARASFRKTWQGGFPVRGSIAVAAQADGRYAITEESDDGAIPTESPDLDACDGVMHEVAMNLPEVKRTLKLAATNVRPGGLGMTNEGSHVSSVLGFHHPDRFETVFVLDWDSETFSVKKYGEDLAIDPLGQARVRAACPH